MSKPVRVRFAPSPTGLQHLGGIRSALFNWLFARHEHGIFILRLEDTDRERFVPEAITHLNESLAWLGLEPDEGVEAGGEYGPYIQSKRLGIYQKHADQLVREDKMYPCWCSPERLDQLRRDSQNHQTAFKYDRDCLDHPGDPNQPHVLRFKVPAGQRVDWDDAVRGHLEFSTDDLDDFVAIKSDGFPTYNFANVIDDHLMEISHVLRGEEFIPTTPKNLLVYQAFDWKPPLFAHLPQVLGTDRAKLSKRHGAKPALEYREAGYLPEAVINFLALLGWNEGEGSTQEIYGRDELIQKFTLQRIQKSPAVFDPERLIWLNGVWIRSLSLEQLLERCRGFWGPAGEDQPKAKQLEVLKLVQERLKYLAELPELTDFFFTDPQLPAEAFKPIKLAHSADIVRFLAGAHEFVSVLNDDDLADPAKLESQFRTELVKQLGIESVGPLFMTLRIALTGKTATPGLFETMAVLGRATVLRRLKAAQIATQV